MQPNSIYIGDSSLQIHKTLIIPNFKVCFLFNQFYIGETITYIKKNIYPKFYSLYLYVGLLFAVKQVVYFEKY